MQKPRRAWERPGIIQAKQLALRGKVGEKRKQDRTVDGEKVKQIVTISSADRKNPLKYRSDARAVSLRNAMTGTSGAGRLERTIK